MEINDLYQEIILEHNRSPLNYGIIEGEEPLEAHNPLCGDQYRIYLKIEGNRVKNIKFEGKGCALSKASASIMTKLAMGKTIEEVLRICKSVMDRVKGNNDEKKSFEGDEEISVLGGVSKYPSRIKCVTLSWHGLMGYINKYRA